MTVFYSIVIIIFCLLIFLKKFLNSSQEEPNDGKRYENYSNKITPDSFRLRPSLLNSNERVFFEQLKIAVGGVYDIYPQVHLGAIFQPIKYGHNWAEINKLNKKIDFVLYDKNTQTPKIAIELDGDSHSHYKSFKRDEFVGQIFQKFNIPLIRFNNGNYSAEEIKKEIDKY
jgi:hypothetical protein